MKRYIAVNPDGPWIQGDIHSRTPEDAVRSMEAKFSQPTANDVWLVFEAPAGFPSTLESYASDDPKALGILAEAYHVEVTNGLKPEQPDLFGAPGLA